MYQHQTYTTEKDMNLAFRCCHTSFNIHPMHVHAGMYLRLSVGIVCIDTLMCMDIFLSPNANIHEVSEVS